MGLRLNVGCGPSRFEGEIGVDKYPTDAREVEGDILALPYPDGAAEFIRAEHVLEHLPYRQVPTALFELRRVLEPGGRIRLGVPDLKRTCEAYVKATTLAERGLLTRQLYGSQIHEGEFHKSGWDPDTLGDVLKAIGFTDIVSSVENGKDLWDASIIVEAVRA